VQALAVAVVEADRKTTNVWASGWLQRAGRLPGPDERTLRQGSGYYSRQR
jgi:hypothetical protein